MFASSTEGCMDPLKKETGGPGPSKPEGSSLSRGDRQRREALQKEKEDLENVSLEKEPLESLHGA